MGNRAVIAIEGSKIGVYLHWNGGVESVLAFLDAAHELGIRSPSSDPSYFYARFTQMIGNFFGGTTSIGIDLVERLDTDNGDNGTFIIGDGEQGRPVIVKRQHAGEHQVAIKSFDLLPLDGERWKLRTHYQGVKDDTIAKNKPIFKREAV